MRSLKSSLIIVLFYAAKPMGVSASGFVKDSAKTYTKIYYALSPKRTASDSTATPEQSFTETTSKLGIYSEVGLGLFPFKSQIALDLSLKSIKRSGKNGATDSFESRGLTDAQISTAASLYDGELGQVFNSSVYLAVAPKLSLIVPTTSKKFRQGNESARNGNAPSGREFLIAALDRGQWRTKPALGISIASHGLWTSLHASQIQNVVPSAPEHQWGADLGASLPANSWLQLGFSQSRSADYALNENLQTKTIDNIQHKFNVGLGITFFQGFALELGAERLVPKTPGTASDQYTFGMSYRDI